MALIDRGRVMIDYLDNLGKKDSYKAKFEALCKAIDEAPSVEAAHSRWGDEEAGYKNCLACGWEHPTIDRLGYSVADDFCPACGVKMDLKDE